MNVCYVIKESILWEFNGTASFLHTYKVAYIISVKSLYYFLRAFHQLLTSFVYSLICSILHLFVDKILMCETARNYCEYKINCIYQMGSFYHVKA